MPTLAIPGFCTHSFINRVSPKCFLRRPVPIAFRETVAAPFELTLPQS